MTAHCCLLEPIETTFLAPILHEFYSGDEKLRTLKQRQGNTSFLWQTPQWVTPCAYDLDFDPHLATPKVVVTDTVLLSVGLAKALHFSQLKPSPVVMNL